MCAVCITFILYSRCIVNYTFACTLRCDDVRWGLVHIMRCACVSVLVCAHSRWVAIRRTSTQIYVCCVCLKDCNGAKNRRDTCYFAKSFRNRETDKTVKHRKHRVKCCFAISSPRTCEAIAKACACLSVNIFWNQAHILCIIDILYIIDWSTPPPPYSPTPAAEVKQKIWAAICSLEEDRMQYACSSTHIHTRADDSITYLPMVPTVMKNGPI